jgi:phenylacetate-CoA ligase
MIGTVLENPSALSNIPYVDKMQIREHYNDMFSHRVDLETLEWEYTSGTTGTPLRIGKTLEERTRLALDIMRWRKANFDIDLSAFYAFFTSMGVDIKSKIAKNVLYLSEIHLDDESLHAHYLLMQKYQVKWMYSTPAVTYVFMNFMKRHQLPQIASLSYIELSGEQLLCEEKIRLGAFFGCRVAEQYGTIELWSVAQECQHGKLHVMERNVVLEILGGRSYITALDLYAMPIIRFHVDDDLEFDTPCDCGVNTKTIRITKSRSKLFLYVGKDIIISPILLNISVNYWLIDHHHIKIEQFLYVQRDYNSLTCYLQFSDESFSLEQIQNLLIRKLLELYPFPESFRIEVLRVDSLIPFMIRGKLGYFKSELPNPLIKG